MKVIFVYLEATKYDNAMTNELELFFLLDLFTKYINEN
jgi:hypothetical protein